MALGGTLREPANAAYLYDALAVGGREDDFAKLFGRLTAIATGGFLLGTLVGAPVAQATSLQVPVALSVVPYATAFAVALLLSEPPRRRREQRRGYVQTIRESGAVFRRDPAMRYLVLLSVGTAFAAAAQIILLQPFLRAHDVPIAAFGLILTPLRLVSMGGSVSAYLLGRALGLRRVFALLSVGPIVMLLLVAGIDHVSMFLALGAINAFAMLRQPLFIDYMNRRTDADVRVTVLSIRRLGIAVVLAVASPLGGALGERSLQLAFVALAFACAIVVVPAYLLWLRADRAGAAHE